MEIAQGTVERVKSTGTMLATGGVLFVLSFGLETIGLTRAEREGQIVSLPLYAFNTGLMFLGAVLVGIGLWHMRAWEPRLGRIGRAGLYLCIASFVSFGLMALTAFISAAQTGRPPDIFVFFGLGLLFSIVGPILLGTGLKYVGWLGLGRLLPFAVAGGTILAFVPTDPWHDIGLLILGLSWAGLGVLMLLRSPGARSRELW
jgi:hypothetical protein